MRFIARWPQRIKPRVSDQLIAQYPEKAKELARQLETINQAPSKLAKPNG